MRVEWIYMVVLLCGMRGRSHAVQANTAWDNQIRRAFSAGNRAHADSVLFWLLEAQKKGMPRDSLFFLISDWYYDRGVLDTALAMNLAVKEPGSRRFRVQVLSLRKRIYSSLGMNGRAAALEDTLRNLTRFSVYTLTPALLLGLEAGGGWQEYVEPIGYPDQPVPRSPARQETGGPQLGAWSGLEWRLPLWQRADLTLGARATCTRPYYIAASWHTTDSIALSLEGRAGISNFLGGFSLEYKGGMYRDVYADQVQRNTVTLSRILLHEGRVTFFSGGYQVDLDRGAGIEDRYGWLMAYHGPLRGGGARLSLTLSGYGADPFDEANPYLAMYVEDVTADTVIHYRGPGFTNPITFDGMNRWEIAQAFISDPYTNYYEPVTLATRSPQTYIELRPEIAWQFVFTNGLRVEPGVTARFDLYPDPYTWYDFEATATPSGDSRWLVFNRADSSYYLVDEIPNVATHSFLGRATYHEVRRLDLTAGLSLAVRRQWARLGRLTLLVAGGRTFSTVADDAPIDVPRWDLSATLQWQKEVTFVQR